MKQFFIKKANSTRDDVKGYMCDTGCYVICNQTCSTGCYGGCKAGCAESCVGGCVGGVLNYI